MRQRTLGKTGIEVTELALGTWGLGGDAYGPCPEDEAKRVIERARAMGITLYETATNYGAGRVEKNLGEILRGDEDALVVTKWGTDLDASPVQKKFDIDFLRRTAEASLERLGEGTRVVALLHNPSKAAIERGEALDFLAELTKSGRLASYGVSVSHQETAEAALDRDVPIISLPYNVLQVQPLRALSERLRLEERGVLVHSVLAYGLLVGRWAPNKDFPAGDHRLERWPDGALRTRIRHLDGLRPVVSGDVTTMRAAALRFALVPEIVSSVVLGPKSGAQLDQLVREAKVEPPYLSEQKLSGLEGRLSHLGVPR